MHKDVIYQAMKCKFQQNATLKNVIYQAMKCKFQQNATLKSLLLATGNVKIAEATRDPTWGVGLTSFDQDALDDKKWKREGLMCELYANLRAELRNE